jgi:hypothetical protein
LTPSTRRLRLKRSSLKQPAVHIVLYPSIFIKTGVEGESVVGKGATGITADPRGLSSEGHSKNVGSFTRR